MNLQKFIFKLIILLSYLLRLGLMILPVATVVVISKEGAWQYGFTFIQNNMEVALFISFAVAFLISLYHALSFEKIGEGPIGNYLKAHQKVIVKDKMSIEELEGKMLANGERFKDVRREGGVLTAKRKVYFLFPDHISIQKSGDLFVVDSKPFSKIWFIDFGRNFKTVKEIAQSIKIKK